MQLGRSEFNDDLCAIELCACCHFIPVQPDRDIIKTQKLADKDTHLLNFCNSPFFHFILNMGDQMLDLVGFMHVFSPVRMNPDRFFQRKLHI